MSKASASPSVLASSAHWLSACAVALVAAGCGSSGGTGGGGPGGNGDGGGLSGSSGGYAGGGASSGGSTSGGSAAGGSAAGGAATGGSTSVPSNQTDEYVARRIAGIARNMMVFLWNRDMVAVEQTEFSVGDSCLLTGAYTAAVKRTFLEGSCDGTSTLDITMTAEECEHDWGVEGESAVFEGMLYNQGTQTYAGTCSAPESQSATFTATGLTVTYQRTESATGDAFEKIVEDCDLELNYSLSGSTGQATLSGRACGQDVLIEYDQ